MREVPHQGHDADGRLLDLPQLRGVEVRVDVLDSVLHGAAYETECTMRANCV